MHKITGVLLCLSVLLVTVSTAQLTNVLSISLLEGFKGDCEVAINVDSKNVYRAKPKTNPVIGLADGISVTNVTKHPIVVINILGSTSTWSNKVDLAVGGLGISLSTNGQIHVIQREVFYFE